MSKVVKEVQNAFVNILENLASEEDAIVDCRVVAKALGYTDQEIDGYLGLKLSEEEEEEEEEEEVQSQCCVSSMVEPYLKDNNSCIGDAIGEVKGSSPLRSIRRFCRY